MGWKWNDAVGAGADGFMNYGPWGLLAAIPGGWAKDLDKGLTGDSRSGLVEKAYGWRNGNIGTKLAGNFSGDERDQQFTTDGKFDFGKSIGSAADLYAGYAGMQNGGGGQKTSGGGGGGMDYGGMISSLLSSFGDGKDDSDLPANAGISFGNDSDGVDFGGGSGGGNNYGQYAKLGAGVIQKFLSNKDRVSQNKKNGLDENGSPVSRGEGEDSIFSGDMLSKVFDLLGKGSETTGPAEGNDDANSETGETNDFAKLLRGNSLPIAGPLLGFRKQPSLGERLRGSLATRRGY